jgi:hypothetical protein
MGVGSIRRHENTPPNTFGGRNWTMCGLHSNMSRPPTDASDDENQESSTATWRRELDIPDDREIDSLDARELPPPKPLQKTLERVADLDEETVLVQLNDREPQFLYPKLDDRGFEYRTETVDDVALTAIWR